MIESPGRLGKVDARLATTGNPGLIKLAPPPVIAAPPIPEDGLRIFPTHVLTRPPAISSLASMVYSAAGVAAIGGIGVFGPTQEIAIAPDSLHMAGLAFPDFGAFFMVMSAALLIVEMVRRRGAVAAKGMATELPQNLLYQMPDGVTVLDIPPTGRSHSQGPMTMRPITQHGLVVYVIDSAGPRPREGFSLIRESDGLAPLLIPLEMVRMAVLQGEIAQTPFRAPHEMPSVTFRDPVTKQVFRISPSWNLNPSGNHLFDSHAQIVGVVVKNDKREIVLSLPWVDGWMTHSPMTYEPIQNSSHAWVAPKGWTGGYMTLSQRTEAAAALLGRLPQMTYLTPEQQEAMAMVAAMVAGPQMDPGIARWAVNAVLQGSRSTVYLADQVADVVHDFPREWMFDRPLSVGLDARETFTPELILTIEDRVAMTHHVFPALHDALYLFPPQGSVRPYVPRQRVPRSVVVAQPQPKK